MSWMNEHEIEQQAHQLADHPVLGPATRTLESLMTVVNANSDGWPYWRVPSEAAKPLMRLIMGDGTWRYLELRLTEITEAQVVEAYEPLKAFRDERKLDFLIDEPWGQPEAPSAEALVSRIELSPEAQAALAEIQRHEDARRMDFSFVMPAAEAETAWTKIQEAMANGEPVFLVERVGDEEPTITQVSVHEATINTKAVKPQSLEDVIKRWATPNEEIGWAGNQDLLEQAHELAGFILDNYWSED